MIDRANQRQQPECIHQLAFGLIQPIPFIQKLGQRGVDGCSGQQFSVGIAQFRGPLLFGLQSFAKNRLGPVELTLFEQEAAPVAHGRQKGDEVARFTTEGYGRVV